MVEEAVVASKIFQIGANNTKKLVDTFADLDMGSQSPYFILVEFLSLLLHLTSRLTNRFFPSAEHAYFMSGIFAQLMAQFDAFLNQNQMTPADRKKLVDFCEEKLKEREQEYAQSTSFFPAKDGKLEASLFWMFAKHLTEISNIEGLGLSGETLADEALKELGNALKETLAAQ